MNIVLGMMTHNEEKRYLWEVLQSTKSWVDKYVFLDNASTDNTVLMINDFLASVVPACTHDNSKVYESSENAFIFNEAKCRNKLISYCLEVANYDEWIFILDADEVLANGKLLKKMINDFSYKEYTVFYAPVYDMWTKGSYRNDDLWRGHLNNFPIGFDKTIGTKYLELMGNLHCGRIPPNCLCEQGFTLDNVAIKHLGWSSSEDRIKKYERYMKLDINGRHGSLAQYESILDLVPNLSKWNDAKFGER